jgi:cob(I)alamin adenosyltransferase
MTKIYTKTGDRGDTGLFGGPRVSKDDPRIEAYGTLDELNAAIGVARAAETSGEADTTLARIQCQLFDVGAELATPDAKAHDMERIGGAQVSELEQAIDRFEADLEPLKQFILPAGSEVSARLHFARTICRRAERCVVSLRKQPDVSVRKELLVYLNRLSDLLFVLARWSNRQAGAEDELWKRE